ncbi:MAG: TSUP family transporter [Fusobacteriaceae bacterium]
MDIVFILLSLLTLGAVIFAVTFFKDYSKAKAEGKLEKEGSTMAFSITGFAINFFDTLGIGGFAPMTAVFKNFNLVKDGIIPGTLNTAMCIPVIAEAIIFIKEVKVEPMTLISMLIAAVAGAVIGAGIVSKLDEKKIQKGMGVALFCVVLIMLAGKLGLMPVGGEAIGLSGTKLAIAVVGNFILGALMTLGIGLYAPCMALVYALGMSPLVAFPIMMASCAYLMPAASMKFIKEGAYNRRATMIITITGVVGVIVAAYLVKSLPLNILTWLVMCVIAYTSIKLLKDSAKK